MRTRLTIPAVALAGVLALGAAACSDDDSTSTTATSSAPATTAPAGEEAAGTIVEIAAGNDDFSTLVAAVQAAGLAETLSGEGPYTVFAPTNAAFEALPAGVVESLLEPANKDTLTQILTYHVVAGEVMAADVEPGAVMTVEGTDFTIEVDGGEVFIVDGQGNRAQVVTTDIVASNGVIHVIDAVLLPAGVTV